MGAYTAAQDEWRPCSAEQIQQGTVLGKDLAGRTEFEADLIINKARRSGSDVTKRKCVQEAIAAGMKPGVTVYCKKKDYGPMIVEAFNSTSPKALRCRVKNGPMKTFFASELSLTPRN
jgi:hypothetical protein